MYVRPNNRYPSGLRLPENYSGNTFRAQERESQETEPETVIEESAESSAPTTEAAALLTQDIPSAPSQKRFSLFGKSGSNEELLILALILLLSDGNGNDDLILFLMLLLFIK